MPFNALTICCQRRRLFRPALLSKNQPLSCCGEIAPTELLDGFSFALCQAIGNRVASLGTLAEPFSSLCAGFFRRQHAMKPKRLPPRLSATSPNLVLHHVAFPPRRQDPQSEAGHLVIPNEVLFPIGCLFCIYYAFSQLRHFDPFPVIAGSPTEAPSIHRQKFPE